MVVKSLTPKQQRVLDYIRTYIEEKGYSPSLAEVAEHFERSIPTIHQYIDTLVEKGFLKRDKHAARSLMPVEKERSEILLLGEIAAGEPIEPLENPVAVEIPPSMLKAPGNYYALKVRGDSMIEEGIMDEDIIVVKHQKSATDGDTIVAVTEDGATLKIFRKNNDKVFLEPRNQKLDKIYPEELEIRGKFIGLLRED